MKAQYKEMFLVIAPCSAIFLILAISQMVINITAAKTARETIQYIGVTLTPTSINIHITREIRPAPINNPIAAIARPLRRDLLNRAIRAMRPNTNEVRPNVTPNINQSIKMVNVDSIMPINIV